VVPFYCLTVYENKKKIGLSGVFRPVISRPTRIQATANNPWAFPAIVFLRARRCYRAVGLLVFARCLSLSVFRSRSSGNQWTVKVKVAHTRLPSVGFRSWSRCLAVSLQVTWVINPAVGCHHFPPGLQLPPATLKRAATNFAAWWTEARWVWTVCLRLSPGSVATAIWTRTLLHLSPAL